MSEIPQGNQPQPNLPKSKIEFLALPKRKVFARMNAIIGGRPVQQGKLKRIDLTKETFEWKGAMYGVDLESIKIEKIKWPKKQRIVIDYDIKQFLPMTYQKRDYQKDALWVAAVLKKGMVKSVLHGDQTMKMIALVAMIIALIGVAAALYAFSNPQAILDMRSGKAKPTSNSTSTVTIPQSSDSLETTGRQRGTTP